MRKRTSKLIVATAASGALALGAPTLAYAQVGDEGDGLIGVANDNNVAANVCGNDVNAAVLGEVEDKNKTNCKNKINEGPGKKRDKEREKEAPKEEEEAPKEEAPEEVEEAAPAEAEEKAPSFAG